jgi:hypothetical protein
MKEYPSGLADTIAAKTFVLKDLVMQRGLHRRRNAVEAGRSSRESESWSFQAKSARVLALSIETARKQRLEVRRNRIRTKSENNC